jgi:hypothetical protein
MCLRGSQTGTRDISLMQRRRADTERSLWSLTGTLRGVSFHSPGPRGETGQQGLPSCGKRDTPQPRCRRFPPASARTSAAAATPCSPRQAERCRSPPSAGGQNHHDHHRDGLAARHHRRPPVPSPRGELGHTEFLHVLREDEIACREATSIPRRLRKVRFEEQATLDGSDFTAAPNLLPAPRRPEDAVRPLESRHGTIIPGHRSPSRQTHWEPRAFSSLLFDKAEYPGPIMQVRANSDYGAPFPLPSRSALMPTGSLQ